MQTKNNKAALESVEHGGDVQRIDSWRQQQKLIQDVTAEPARDSGGLDKVAVGEIKDIFQMQIQQDQLMDWI